MDCQNFNVQVKAESQYWIVDKDFNIEILKDKMNTIDIIK